METHFYGVINVTRQLPSPAARLASVMGDKGPITVPIAGKALDKGQYLVWGMLISLGGRLILAVTDAVPSGLAPFARVAGSAAGGHVQDLRLLVAAADGGFEGLWVGLYNGEMFLSQVSGEGKRPLPPNKPARKKRVKDEVSPFTAELGVEVVSVPLSPVTTTPQKDSGGKPAVLRVQGGGGMDFPNVEIQLPLLRAAPVEAFCAAAAT